MTPEQLREFDSYINARRDYRLYQDGWVDGWVDETENLPPGIHASIIRWEGNPSEGIEDEEPPTNPAKSDLMEF